MLRLGLFIFTYDFHALMFNCILFQDDPEHRHVTLVISPLEALMQDQMFKLENAGVPSIRLSSNITTTEQKGNIIFFQYN